MPHIERPDGLRLSFPAEWEVVDAPREHRAGTRGAGRFQPRPLLDMEEDPLVEALSRLGMEPVASEELRPGPAARTRGAPATQGDITLRIPVPPGEEAVVLVESDGVYAWSLPEEPRATAPGATRRTRGMHAAEPAERTFRVRLPEGPSAPPPRTRGLIGDAVIGRVRTWVLRFAARAVTGRVVSYLESDVQTGPVMLAGRDVNSWLPLGELDLPPDRPARLLLLLHGTFSSTRGAYGSLAATPWGRQLLGRTGAYDAVLGFDHRSLAVAPRQNAIELLDFIRMLGAAHPPRLDIVSHSRGGLVYRSLAEQVLPGMPAEARPRLERAVFVGVPNAGTTLADADNWRDFIDLYTNIALGACRFIGRLPQATAVTTVLAELIQGIGGLVRALAEQALESGDVPGLSALRPDGDFLRELNRTQDGQPRADATFYCAVTSEFRASLGEPHAPPELPRRLLMGLVDRVADRVLGEANDLVVNTASMTAIDGGGAWIKDRLHFDHSPHIYHTNYFARPEVVNALTRWLDLGGETITLAPVLRLPARVDTDISVLPAWATVGELVDLLRSDQPAWIVLRRPHEGRMLSYAYRRDELEQKLGRLEPDAVLRSALDLCEDRASPDCGAPDAAGAEPGDAAANGEPTAGRVVVLEGGAPVGVIAPGDLRTRSADVLVTEAERAAPVPKMEPAAPAPAVEAAPPPMAPAPASGPASRRTRSAGRTTRRARPAPAPQPGEAKGTAEPEAAPAEPARPSARRAPERKATVHFQAEMEDTVAVGETTPVLFTVSREAIEHAAGGAVARADTEVETDRKLSVMVRPRKNFKVAGDWQAEADVPAIGAPVDLYFDVVATHEGPGEVWVVVRQGQTRELAVMKLCATIVTERPRRRGVSHAEARSAEAPAGERPLCQLRIFERDNGDRICHDYELQIPGRVLEIFSSRPMKTDRASYVARLYEQIEERWLSSSQDVADFVQELREMGGTLFDELFPPELQRALWENRDALKSIQVISTEPFIPWELVHLKEPGEPLPDESLFLAELGLVRWLHGSWFPDVIRLRPERVRYVVPDYPHPDDKLPEARAERRFLERTFDAQEVEPQPAAVRKLLRGPGAFDLLHFACHGVADSGDIGHAALLLEGRVEGGNVIPSSIDVATVRETSRLRDEAGNRPLVVLNACQVGRLGFSLTRVGGFAEAFLRRGAGAFIGSLWSVGDRSARVFTETLYDALKEGMALAPASAKARAAAAKEGDASWLAYAVYGHPELRVEGF